MQKSQLVKPRGSTIRLKCRATGKPKPDIHWFHNGALLQREELPGQDDDDSPKHDKWTLKLSDVIDDHDGRYMCRVQNRAGAINFTYNVEVVGKPMAATLEGCPLLTDTNVMSLFIYIN